MLSLEEKKKNIDTRIEDKELKNERRTELYHVET